MRLFLITVGILWQAVIALGVLLAIGSQLGTGWEIAVIPVLIVYCIGSVAILARLP